MAQINITFQDVNEAGKNLKLVTFNGQLDETNVDNEAQQIYRVIEEMAEPNLLFDFAGLEYMNSKSIGYVTDWYTKVMTKNGKIVIARPRANILDILKVVGITQIVNIYDNLDTAKAAFATETATAKK
jgi:stage II sporulation protein AA (anti-sigma F factor antagonist)